VPRQQSTPPHSLFLEALGTAFRKIRRERGESQADVAFTAGIHFTTYGKIERGKENPGFENQAQIVLALETSFTHVGELVDGFLEGRTRKSSAGNP
jgi:transcriptional regulator with XRE-family HTH domain